MSSTSSSLLRSDQIWLDGQLMKWEQGQVHIMTHALHYGLGAFEGIRAYRTHDGRLAVFRLQEHIDRLFDSAHICMMKMPFTREQVVEAVAAIRKLDLKKSPSISETLDWAQSLALLNAESLTADLVASTLNLVLKHEGDIEKAKGQLAQIAQA